MKTDKNVSFDLNIGTITFRISIAKDFVIFGIELFLNLYMDQWKLTIIKVIVSKEHTKGIFKKTAFFIYNWFYYYSVGVMRNTLFPKKHLFLCKLIHTHQSYDSSHYIAYYMNKWYTLSAIGCIFVYISVRSSTWYKRKILLHILCQKYIQ